MTKKFPRILHVTIDEPPNDESCLLVCEGGVTDIAVAGSTKPCALYQLIEVGTVVAPPKFISKRKAR